MVRGRSRRRWQRRWWVWWDTYVRPPGSPNLWVVTIPLMLAGAALVAWLAGLVMGDDVGSIVREIVKNPFRPPKR
jgi:hypothetical protein